MGNYTPNLFMTQPAYLPPLWGIWFILVVGGILVSQPFFEFIMGQVGLLLVSGVFQSFLNEY